MNNAKLTVYDVIGLATEAGEWVNGEFEAVVRNATAKEGKKPSKADLCDPDSPNIMVQVAWFGGDFTRIAGDLCLFGGQGMKVKNYKGKIELTMSDKSTINVLRAAPEPAGKTTATTPAAPPAQRAAQQQLTGAAAVEKFHKIMQQNALLMCHADQYLTDVETKRGMVFLPEQRQGALATLFIAARQDGLRELAPALRPLGADKLPLRFVPAAKPAVDPAAQKAANEKAALEAAEKVRREAELKLANQGENVDEDVPF